MLLKYRFHLKLFKNHYVFAYFIDDFMLQLLKQPLLGIPETPTKQINTHFLARNLIFNNYMMISSLSNDNMQKKCIIFKMRSKGTNFFLENLSL